MARLVIALSILLSLTGIAGWAGEGASLLPEVPKATGTPHAEGNEYWRRNHMRLMIHDRDLTVREGERDIEASLKGCFDCHTVKDDHGTPVTVKSEKHFCRVCHDYAAVKVDCFMCHRSTPDGVDEHAIEAAMGQEAGMITTPEGSAGPGAVRGYLKKLAGRRGSQTAEAGE